MGKKELEAEWVVIRDIDSKIIAKGLSEERAGDIVAWMNEDSATFSYRAIEAKE